MSRPAHADHVPASNRRSRFLPAALPVVAALIVAAIMFRPRGDAAGAIVETVALDQQPIGALADGSSGRLFVLTADGATAGYPRPDTIPHGNGRVLVFDAGSAAAVGQQRASYLPCAVVADDRAGHILVASDAPDNIGGSVLLLDARNGHLLHVTETDAAPCNGAPAVDSRSGRAFFGGGDDSVSAFDTRTGALVGTTRAYAAGEVRLAVDEPHGHVFAVLADTGAIAVLDASSGRRLRPILLRGAHGSLRPVADPAAGRLFVVDRGASAVSTLDARSGALRTIATVAVAQDPTTWALDDEGTFSHFLVAGGTALSVLDARTGAVVRTLALGVHTDQILVDPRAHRAFLFTGDNLGATQRVPVVDTRTDALVGTVVLPGVPLMAAIDARRGRLVVADDQGTIDVLDTRTGRLVHALAGELSNGNAVAVALDAATGRAFVVHGGGVRAVPDQDRWTWMPAWLRDRLPFLPRQGVSYQPVPAGITVVDDTR